jgi:uncharacterized protein (TIGR03437 family)
MTTNLCRPCTQHAVRVAIVCAGVIGLHAQDTRPVTEPVFPPVCAQLPAQLSAGPAGLPLASETLFDTSRIQSALNGCPAGQAVELQTGGSNAAFLIAPITLPKGVTLLVDAGVTVFTSRNPRDYDADSTHSCGTVATTNTGCVPLISANQANGAGLMGYGTIDGRGQLPMLINGAPSAASWWDLATQAKTQFPAVLQNCPKMLWVNSTDSFTLHKITLRNSPFYHVQGLHDTNFTAWGIKIVAPYDAYNTDGVNLGFSSNVTVTNSYISEGDDNVVVYGSSPSTTGVSVIDNRFGDGHGASIGNDPATGIANVMYDGISFAGNAANADQIGVRIKSNASFGGLIQNISFTNICMQNVHEAIVLDPFYNEITTGNLIPQFTNITIQDMHATTEGTVKIEGYNATVPTGVTLNNVQVDGIKSSDVTTQYANVTLGLDPVNFASMLTGTGVTVAGKPSTSNPAYSCPASIFSPIAGELIPGPPQIASGQSVTVTVQVFPTKAQPYQTWLANLKTNPNATLALAAPTGTVTILDGTAVVGTGTLNSSPLLPITVANLGVGSHTLTAAYSGDANYAAIAFGNYSVSVAPPGTPVIAPGGIVNAASYTSGIPPYGLAQGSLFSIFGTDLGPAQPVQASAFPLPTSMGGASVQILEGGIRYDAFLQFVSSGQINAILPSNVPIGLAQVTVGYNGIASQPAIIRVVKTSVGIFFQPANGGEMAIAQNYVDPTDYPLNQPAVPAMPGQIVVLWGTGMGPIAGADNLAPGTAAGDMSGVPVSITVGGVAAQRLYAGRQSESAAVDVIYFTVPQGVPYGCQIPVAVTAGGLAANSTVIAVTSDGAPCH